MLKFASFSVLSATLARPGIGSAIRITHTGSRAVFRYQPREGYLFVRSRAISSRCNDNYDAFPAEEIAAAYKTFVGKPVFVNHHNENHRRARGFIIDAALHRDTNPDGSPDTWAEVLMEVDAKRFPILAKAVLSGHIDRTSMGVDVHHSICSVCNKTATSPSEYCQHIPQMKGQRVYRTGSDGRREGVLVFESCFGLKFFENSLLVEPPADPTAVIVSVEDGNQRTASRRTAFSPLSKGSDDDKDDIASSGGPEHATCGECGEDIYRSPSSGNWIHKDDSGAGIPHMGRPAAKEGARSWPVLAGYAEDEPWLFEARNTKKRSEMTPAELAADDKENAKARRWNEKHKPSYRHIINSWNRATDDEKANGMSWYGDAHDMAKHLANDTGTSMHTMAGLVANYSPQTPWATNMMNASKVATAKRGMGGEGSGMMATDGQRVRADRLLAGESHHDVITGHKVSAFARLIEDGGNDHDVCVDRHAISVATGHRCPDRAYTKRGMGAKFRYEEHADAYRRAARIISRHEKRTVHPHQVQATTWLTQQRENEEEDRRLSKTMSSSIGSQAQNAARKWAEYAQERHPELLGKEPGTGYSQRPERRVSTLDRRYAYGETKAPANVDTLREDTCPVCGESSNAYDGDTCPVCGYQAPPEFLRDPDLEKARQLDLRKDVLQQDPATANDPVSTNQMRPVGQDPSQTVDPGMLDENGQPIQDAPGGRPMSAQDVATQQMQQIQQSGQPITPDMLDESGLLVWGTPFGVMGEGEQPGPADGAPGGTPQVDMGAADQHFNQGGEAFTSDPNAPQPMTPGAPKDQISPWQVDENGNPLAPDGQPLDPGAGQGVPGTPGDGVPDLMCPNCGYQADASQPTSMNMDQSLDQQPDTGTMAGDVCPNCGAATLLSPQELQQMQQPQVSQVATQAGGVQPS